MNDKNPPFRPIKQSAFDCKNLHKSSYSITYNSEIKATKDDFEKSYKESKDTLITDAVDEIFGKTGQEK